jgi:hypothetical protein
MNQHLLDQIQINLEEITVHMKQIQNLIKWTSELYNQLDSK